MQLKGLSCPKMVVRLPHFEGKEVTDFLIKKLSILRIRLLGGDDL
jgi:hypothetical protein